MTKTRFSLTAAATLVLSTTFLSAQSAPADAGQAAKQSPYQGVSTPPANDAITTSEQAPAAPAVVTRPAPAPAATPAPPPAAASNPDAGIVETPLPPSAPGSNTLNARGLDSSKDNTDEGIVTYVPAPANALPEGTVF